MQGWEIWLVPLIAMAVWILGSLLRGGLEERQRDNLPRPGPGGGPEGGRPSRPVSDLERFLEEVHRRRQAAAEKRERESPREPPSSSPERVESRPRPRSVPAPVRPPPPPRRPPRPAPPPVARRPPPKPQTVLEEPVVVEVVREGPQPIEPPPPPVEAVPLPAAPPPPPPTPPRRPAARVSPSLAALLSSAEGLRHAFIVREILDPPLCKRRR